MKSLKNLLNFSFLKKKKVDIISAHSKNYSSFSIFSQILGHVVDILLFMKVEPLLIQRNSSDPPRLSMYSQWDQRKSLRLQLENVEHLVRVNAGHPWIGHAQ